MWRKWKTSDQQSPLPLLVDGEKKTFAQKLKESENQESERPATSNPPSLSWWKENLCWKVKRKWKDENQMFFLKESESERKGRAICSPPSPGE